MNDGMTMPIVLIPAVAVILIVVLILTLGYTKVPPNRAAVITGLQDKPFLSKSKKQKLGDVLSKTKQEKVGGS